MAEPVIIIDSPDSETLPSPSTPMFEFYEGLDSNLFSESTGINHNAAAKWTKAELARHLDFLSYLLNVKSNTVIMSNDIVHTDSIIDGSVTAAKLSEEIRGILESGDLYNVIERNSVQTLNCISATGTDGLIKVEAGAVLSQANGFGTLGQKDLVEQISTPAYIAQTTGKTLTGYLYKVVGGAYVQSTSPLTTLNDNMVGTRVLLGTFKVTASPNNYVYDVVPATPLTTLRDLHIKGNITSPALDALFAKKISKDSDTGAAYIPVGTTAQRPTTPSNGYLRYNTDLVSMEAYSNGAWGSVGGGATGGGTDHIFNLNGQVINSNYTIPTGMNAVTAGDVTIATGVTVTVPTGSKWVIV
jgi:hypothetical protein